MTTLFATGASLLFVLASLAVTPPGLCAQAPSRPTAPVSGPARVVRLDATRAQLDAARARLATRGIAVDFILWRDATGAVAGAAPDASLRALLTEGIRSETLYETIVDYQRATAKAARTDVTPPEEPRYEVRVVVIDRRASHTVDGLGDEETVVRRNDRYLAVLDASAAPESGADLRVRYARRGLAVVDVVAFDAFAPLSARLFPESPFTSNDAIAWRGGEDGVFLSYDEITDGLRALEAAHPTMVRVSSIGQSYEGRRLWVAKISANVEVNDPSKPDVLITGCYHAREWIAADVPYELAVRLPSLYDSDPQVRYLLDHAEVWVLPLVNPDGHAYSQTRPNHAEDNIRMWRKNRRPIDVDGDGLPDGLGVDLNRNHSVPWRVDDDLPYPSTGDDFGASDNPRDFQLYRGPSPGSEPEIRALEAFTADPSHPFVTRIDYHNFGQLVLYPLGYTRDRAIDDGALRSLGAYAQARIGEAGNPYRLLQSRDLYATTGSSVDYAYQHDRSMAYTIELSPPGCCFDLEESLRDGVVDANVPGALAVARWATGPVVVESVVLTASGRRVYAAQWEDGPEGRTLVTERENAISGPVHLSVRFSQPLAAAPAVSVARGGATSTVALTRATPLAYAGDTWEGDLVLPQTPVPTRLLVETTQASAHPAGFDASPATVASYTVGSGAWSGREDGPDLSYSIVPGPDEVAPEIDITTPSGELAAGGIPSVVVPSGKSIDVEWTVSDSSRVVEQSVEVSTDSGNTYSPIATRLPASARSISWAVPARYDRVLLTFRVRASSDAGGVTLSSPSRPVGVSATTIVRAAYKTQKGKLVLRTSPSQLENPGNLEIEIDGERIASVRGFTVNSAGSLVLRATLAQLGLTVGSPASIRLLVEGWPTPPATFTP